MNSTMEQHIARHVMTKGIFLLIFGLILTVIFVMFLRSSIKEIKNDNDETEILLRVFISILTFTLNLYIYYNAIGRIFNTDFYVINYIIGG